MKRALKHLLGTAGLMAVCGCACAQDSFPDTPSTHWAFSALSRLKKDGILIGYPDGMFRGQRPASRYEIAAAVNSALVNLKSQSEGIASQLQALLDRINSGQASSDDPERLREALEAAKNDLNGVKSLKPDVDLLRRLATEFEKELTSMGIDIEEVKDNLAKLDGRVAALEKKKLPIDIRGDLNLASLAGYSSSGEFGISVDGRPTGVGRGSYGAGTLDAAARVGATRDLTILQETAVRLASTNDKGPTWRGTLVAGDMVGRVPGDNPLGATAFGNQSTVAPGSPFMEANESVYLQDFAISLDSSLAGIAFNAEVGRVGFVVNPYIFKRPDNTPYFENDRWDGGEWNFDGAIVTLDYGPTKFKLFGGRNNLSTGGGLDGTALQPMQAGNTGKPFTPGVDRPRGITQNLLTVQQSLGADLNIPITSAGRLNLAYLWLSADQTAPVNGAPANGVRVYGGDVKLGAKQLSLEGGYSKSDLVGNDRTLVDRDNEAYWVSVGKENAKYGASAGYRYIAPQFGAPGDWGRIGIWWNPTDIKGFTSDFHYDLNPALRVSAGGEFYTGAGTPSSTLTTDDKVQRYQFGLSYVPSRAYDFSLGYEEARWDLADRAQNSFTGGSPVERWYNIGFGLNLSAAARFKFLWQISDYDSRGVAGFGPFSNSTSTIAKGGLITTQLSVKF